MGLVFDYCQYSERGPFGQNHDYCLAECRDDVLVLAVADGVGPSKSSARASREAIRMFSEKDPWQNDLYNIVCELSEEFDVPGHTTFASAKIADKLLSVAYVGDSRIYLHRSGNTVLVTKDHNFRFRIEDALGRSYRWISHRRLNKFLDNPTDPCLADDLCNVISELLSEVPEYEWDKYVVRLPGEFNNVRIKRRLWKELKHDLGLCLYRSLGKDSSKDSVGILCDETLSVPCIYNASPGRIHLLHGDIVIVATDGAYCHLDADLPYANISDYARNVVRRGSLHDDATIAIASVHLIR